MSAARFDYFLTYARSDVAAARELVERLESFGIRVGCDFGDGGLRSGETWIPQLAELLQLSDSYLILVGEREIKGWVLAELEVALDRNAKSPAFRIVPLLLPGISPADLPAFLGRFEVIPLAEDWRLAGSVSLARLLVKLRPRREGALAKSPFPGLRAFDAAMSAYFFGRAGELQQILRMLGSTPSGHRRWLQIEGASGSGKSSLAQAGLLPAVDAGLIDGAPPTFQSLAFRPGRQPVRSLAQALFRGFECVRPGLELRAVEEALARDPGGLLYLLRENLPVGRGFLLLVDQLEELFSLAAGDLGPARQLAALLAAALDDSDFPFYLVTTIRSDFLGELAKSPELVRHLNDRASRFLLPEIGAIGLAEAVRQPALVAGLGWENESLPERIVRDAGLSPGSLPLVAHVLAEMWARDARGGVLKHETYDRLGGVGGALARSADKLLESFAERERTVAKKMLLSLLQVQPGAAESRRVLGRDELLQAVGGGPAEEVLARLSGGRDPRAPEDAPPPPRLLSVRADQNVELVHEALLRSWQTLARLVEENRKNLECRNDAENAARAWAAAGRPSDGLPRGQQLAYFRKAELVDRLTREFLAAAQAVEDQENRSRRLQKRARRQVAAIGLGLMVLALLVIGWNYELLFVSAVEAIYVQGLDVRRAPAPAQLAHLGSADRLLERVLGEPSSKAHRLLLARIEIARGQADFVSGSYESSAGHFGRAIDLVEASGGRPIDMVYLTPALAGKGRVELRQNRLEDSLATADRMAERIAALPEELRGLQLPFLAYHHLDLANSLGIAGDLERAARQLGAAEEVASRLDLYPVLEAERPAIEREVARAHLYVGWSAQSQYKWDEARLLFEKSAALYQKLRPKLSGREFAMDLGQVLAAMAILARERNDFARAREIYLRIPPLFENLDYLAESDLRFAVFQAWTAVAELHDLENHRDLARQPLEKALAILDGWEALPGGVESSDYLKQRVDVLSRLAFSAASAGDFEAAWKHHQQAGNAIDALIRLDPQSVALKSQRLSCYTALADLAGSQKWKDRLAETLGQATTFLRDFPLPQELAMDPRWSYLLRQTRNAP